MHVSAEVFSPSKSIWILFFCNLMMRCRVFIMQFKLLKFELKSCRIPISFKKNFLFFTLSLRVCAYKILYSPQQCNNFQTSDPVLKQTPGKYKDCNVLCNMVFVVKHSFGDIYISIWLATGRTHVFTFGDRKVQARSEVNARIWFTMCWTRYLYVFFIVTSDATNVIR